VRRCLLCSVTAPRYPGVTTKNGTESGGKWLHLVRHAESNWNVSTTGEHVGAHPHIVDVDLDLSPMGEQQVARIYGDAATLHPPPTLILTSPLTRAVRTALALAGDTGTPVMAEPLLTEWLENSCDVGSSLKSLQHRFGGQVQNIESVAGSSSKSTSVVQAEAADDDSGWWLPLPTAVDGGRSATLAALVLGDRELEKSVDARCAALLRSLQQHEHHSIAVVAHCMVLHKLETLLLQGQFGESLPVRVEYLGNTHTKSILARPAQLAALHD
jgi:broad specificity phosphatase PhoE